MKNKWIKSILLIVILVFFITGCSQELGDSASQEQGEKATVSFPGELTIFGSDVEHKIEYNMIYTMDTIEQSVTHISSSGEESTDDVKGVLLAEVLKALGINKDDYTSARFMSEDGYEITVPAEFFVKDIILAYEFNGEVLEEKKMPLRVVIDGVRSMYFVSNLTKIALYDTPIGTEKEKDTTKKECYILESMINELPKDTFIYYDSEDEVVYTSDLIEMIGEEKINNVMFTAVDGYEKVEDGEKFSEGVIKYTGENAPLFTGLDLPKGMNVKYILTMLIEEKSIVSLNSLYKAMETDSVQLLDLLDMVGLKSKSYELIAFDGYSTIIEGDAMKEAKIIINDEGIVEVLLPDEFPKEMHIKYLISIKEIEDSEAKASKGWAVEFTGLSDGSFDMTQSMAERKLQALTMEVSRTKDGEIQEETWRGYRVLDILEFLHVEDFSEITVVADDGYEVVLSKAEVDKETILGDYKDGKALGEDNAVQLVQNTPFATSWVKDVVKIEVK